MKQTQRLIYTIILATSLVACGIATPIPTAVIATTTPVPGLVPASSASTVPPVTSTSTFNSKTFIITPDALFSILGLKILTTPDSTDFCEHIPPPEVVEHANELSVLAGKFSLCPSISWPFVNTAMDLDKGILVAVVDEHGDIAMDYAHTGLDGVVSYFIRGMNNAHIDEIDTNILNYEYCENLLLPLKRPGILDVNEGAIACVLTTEGKMALIRVEHIYPLDTQGVGLSFAILE